MRTFKGVKIGLKLFNIKMIHYSPTKHVYDFVDENVEDDKRET